MLSGLKKDFTVSFVDAIGTDPRYPPTEGWPHLVDQLLDFLEERRVRLAGMKPKFSLHKVPGGHLFPFEHPQEAARSIARALDALSAVPRAS